MTLLAVSWLGSLPAAAQDAPAATTTTAPSGAAGSAGSPAATTTVASDQTLVEAPKPPERRLITESRRVMAIIGALVAVALALALLTVRYWRHTRPVAPETGTRMPSVLDELDDDAIFVGVPAADVVPDAGEDLGRRSRRSVAGADHASADTDWEPRGTGEHDVVEAPPAIVRPGRTARRAALARPAEA